MAKEEKEKVLTKKEKNRIKDAVIKEINTELKQSICESVVEDVKLTLDLDYKDELKQQISNEIIDDIKNNIKKEQNKLNRRKSFKIFRLYIYLIILMAVSIYAIYCLYNTGYMDILKKGGKVTTTEVAETTTTTTTIVKNFEWYYKEYSPLLDNIKITNYEILKGNYKISNLDSSDKLAMAYYALDNESIITEGVISRINSENMEVAYNTLFNDNAYTPTNFSIYNSQFAYSASNNNYISVDEVKEDSKVINEIVDIKEVNDEVILTAYVAILKDDNIYNVNNLNKAVDSYTVGKSLSEYKNKLSQVEYTFKKDNDRFYLDSIIKK